MSRKQKRMGPVGCFGQIENIKRQSLIYFCRIIHREHPNITNTDTFTQCSKKILICFHRQYFSILGSLTKNDRYIEEDNSFRQQMKCELTG